MRNYITDDVWVNESRLEYLKAKRAGASRTELRAIIERFAQQSGLSVKSVYRKLDLQSRTVTRKVDSARQALIEKCVRELFDFCKSRSYEGQELHWTLGYKHLVKIGIIPSDIPLTTLYAARREMNIDTLALSVMKRWERHSPLSLVQIDYTRSGLFRSIGGGYLEIGPKLQPYKDADTDRRRLWICTAIDDCSRVAYADYVLEPGESPRMTQEFLYRVFSPKDTVVNNAGECVSDQLLQGMPKAIYWDRGPGHKTATSKGLQALGIQYINGANMKDGWGRKTNISNKRGRGKVERFNGEIERKFEHEFSLEHKNGWTIHIDELNEKLADFVRAYNQSKHPRRDMTRWAMFQDAFNEIRYPDESFFSAFIGTERRKVTERLIKYRGEQYVAPEFCRNGEDYEVTMIGDTAYVIHDDTRYPLEQLDRWHKINVSAPVETEDTVLDGRELKMRLFAEIESASLGQLRPSDVRITHGDDIERFFELARTVGETIALAAQIVRECNAAPSNIIMMTDA
jgi:hypothetical protein